MKIIELYTKLANKEIIPRYIKVCERKYEFDESDNEYYPRNENDNDTLLERIGRGNVWAWLNTEVQELNSLEEEKKIPEKSILDVDSDVNGSYDTVIINDAEYQISRVERYILGKINELIDYLKSKGE